MRLNASQKNQTQIDFNQSESRIKDLRLIFLICVQTQILCNGAIVTCRCLPAREYGEMLQIPSLTATRVEQWLSFSGFCTLDTDTWLMLMLFFFGPSRTLGTDSAEVDIFMQQVYSQIKQMSKIC